MEKVTSDSDQPSRRAVHIYVNTALIDSRVICIQGTELILQFN